MDNIQEHLEHYEAQDRERQEREAEIMRHDLQLLMYARNHATPDDDYCRKYMRRNAMIWDYGKTYGTEAQAHLREMLDEARKKFMARAQELAETADIKDAEDVEEELWKQVMDFYRMNNQKAYQLHDIKRRICDELYKFPAVDLLGVLLELQQREARRGGQK